MALLARKSLHREQTSRRRCGAPGGCCSRRTWWAWSSPAAPHRIPGPLRASAGSATARRPSTCSPDAAGRRFGLPEGIPVCVGWSDALAQVLAAGCFERQSAFVFSGTSAIVGVPVTGESPRAAGLFRVPRTCVPIPLLYGPTSSSGASVAWVARLLGCQPADVPGIAAGAAEAIPTFVPYLSGERAPLWNTDDRGLLLGLAAEHGPPEIARAVMAGTLLSARHVLDTVAAATGRGAGEIEYAGRGAHDGTCARRDQRARKDESMGARLRSGRGQCSIR